MNGGNSSGTGGDSSGATVNVASIINGFGRGMLRQVKPAWLLVSASAANSEMFAAATSSTHSATAGLLRKLFAWSWTASSDSTAEHSSGRPTQAVARKTARSRRSVHARASWNSDSSFISAPDGGVAGRHRCNDGRSVRNLANSRPGAFRAAARPAQDPVSIGGAGRNSQGEGRLFAGQAREVA